MGKVKFLLTYFYQQKKPQISKLIFFFLQSLLFVLLFMDLQNTNSFNPIISDSFLRSYSLSRIVKINEQNRNRAKVTIMRKIRTLKQQNRKKYHISPSKSNEGKQKENILTNIKALKQELTRIDSSKQVESKFKKDNMLLNQIKEQKAKSTKLASIHRSKPQKGHNESFHRRFHSDAIQPSSNFTETTPTKIRSKVDNRQQLKAQLRMNDIKFSKSLKKYSSTKYTHDQDQQCTQNTSSLSATLSSFNRLRLLTNAKSSQKIMKHFYKRSLENCTLQDLKYFIKIQKNNKEEDELQQNTNYVPMKFGKSQLLRRTYCSPFSGEQSIKNETQQKKTVWNNQVLRHNCDFNQNTQIVNLKQKRLTMIKDPAQKPIKDTKYASKMSLRQQSKQNFRKQPSFTEINSREAQIEKNLIYCYKGKRFPVNDNKLSGIYEKWQQGHIKKKKIQQFKIRSSYNQSYENRQLRAKSIKLKNNNQQTNKQSNQQINQYDQQNLNDSQTQPSQTSLKQNYHQKRQIPTQSEKQFDFRLIL